MHRTPLFAVAVLSLLTACAPSADVPEEAEAAAASPTFQDAVLRFQAGDLAGAAEILEQVTANDPTNARAFNFLGIVHRQAGDREKARGAFEKAAELNPENLTAVYNIAALEAEAGNVDAAVERLASLGGGFNLSQITLDKAFADLLDDERLQPYLMKPEDFEDPFAEETRILHEWVGEGPEHEFGWIARTIGDVDGDGAEDLVTSAPAWASGAGEDDKNAGRVYVYSGRSGDLLWTRDGQGGDRLGEGLDRARDVNGDGFGDVIAAATEGGYAEVYSGKDGTTIHRFTFEKGQGFGDGVAGVGDVDGDGFGEVLIGAPGYQDNTGRVGLYSGKDGTLLHEWIGEEGDRLGAAVAGAVFRETQGFLVLGAPDAGEGDRGAVRVYRGVSDEPAFVIASDDGGAELGRMFLSVVGDVDADGTPDVYASDFSHSGQQGQIVVHSGADGRELLKIAGEAAGDGFGIGPADAGDVDGDGHADLVVGAWQQSNAAPAGGKVYLYSGKDGSLIRAWTCRVMGDTFGFDAQGMGDVDGDGSVDLLLTSAWSAVRGAKSGRVFLLSSE